MKPCEQINSSWSSCVNVKITSKKASANGNESPRTQRCCQETLLPKLSSLAELDSVARQPLLSKHSTRKHWQKVGGSHTHTHKIYLDHFWGYYIDIHSFPGHPWHNYKPQIHHWPKCRLFSNQTQLLLHITPAVPKFLFPKSGVCSWN